MEISEKEKSHLIKAGLILLVILSVYFLVKIITEVKGFRFVGGGATTPSTISFDGVGEIFASPDLAVVDFTLREEAKEIKEAQTKVTTKEKAVLDFLAENKIADKDIKTESYTSYPKYEWRQGVCPQLVSSDSSYYCPSGKNVLVGYETSEYISVKVRDLAKAGEIIQGIGALGISEISGPNFSIEKEDQLKAEARKIAIDEAKAKAKTLSEDLGVRLVRIVSFSEGENYPTPMYAKDLMMAGREESAVAPAPELPAGENKIVSNVMITYEIR